jgi:hypothetical protein
MGCPTLAAFPLMVVVVVVHATRNVVVVVGFDTMWGGRPRPRPRHDVVVVDVGGRRGGRRGGGR